MSANAEQSRAGTGSARSSSGARVLVLSLVVLALGLLGVSRLRERAGLPFAWENRDRKIIIAKVPSAHSAVVEGDVLASVEGVPLRRGEEIEFILDGKRAGDMVTLTVLRRAQEFSAPIVLSYWYTRRHVLVVLILGLIVWTVGVWVCLHNCTEKPSRLFFYLALVLSLCFTITTARVPAGPPPWRYFLPVIYYLIYPFFPAILLRFVMAFPKEKAVFPSTKIQTTLIFLPALVFVLLLQILHLRAVLAHSMPLFREYFRVFTWHRAYVLVFFLLAMIAMVHSYLTAAGKSEKDKVRWLLWGIAVGCAPFMMFWTLPQIFGMPPLVPEELAYLAMMAAPISFAFAIVKYHIFDIAVVINRSIVYALLTAFIAGLYLLLVGLAGNFLLAMSPQANSFAAILCTLVAALAFNPAKQGIQSFVDRTFYRVQYNYRATLTEFGQSLSEAQNRAEVLEALLAKIQRVIPIEKLAVLLPQNGVFEVRAHHGLNQEERSRLSCAENAEPAQRLKRHPLPLAKKGRADPGSADDLPHSEALERSGIEIMLPVTMGEGGLGLLLLGRKFSGGRYSDEDLALLSTLAAEALNACERIRFQEAAIVERAEREKLEELNRLKSDFVSHVSHELRTPLTVISWSARNLLEGIPEKPSPKVREYLDGIHSSSAYLSRMIENLLDVTRIEAGKLEFFPERLMLAEAIPAVIKTISPLAFAKKILLEIGEMKNLCVRADRDALQEILFNLIENAIKYSPCTTTVRVHAAVAPIAPPPTSALTEMIAIRICDCGPGIPADKQQAIFERFERVAAPLAPREKGLGLGLFIVKKLVEVQGGKIWVENEMGKGSTFIFTLPEG